MRPSYPRDQYNGAAGYRDLNSSYGDFLRRHDHSDHPNDYNRRYPYPQEDYSRTYNGPQRPAFDDERIRPIPKTDFWRSPASTSQVVTQRSGPHDASTVSRAGWPDEQRESQAAYTRPAYPRNGIVRLEQARSFITYKKQAFPPKRKLAAKEAKRKAKLGQKKPMTNSKMSDKEIEEAAQLQIKMMAELESKAFEKEKNDESGRKSCSDSSTVSEQLESTSKPEVMDTSRNDVSDVQESSASSKAPLLKDADISVTVDQSEEDKAKKIIDAAVRETSPPKRKLRILDSKFEDVHLFHRVSKSSYEPQTMKSLQSKYKPVAKASAYEATSFHREKNKASLDITPVPRATTYAPNSSRRSPGMSFLQTNTSAPHNGPVTVGPPRNSTLQSHPPKNGPSYVDMESHDYSTVDYNPPRNGPSLAKKSIPSNTETIDPDAYIEDLSDLDEDWSEVVSMLKPLPARTTIAPQSSARPLMAAPSSSARPQMVPLPARPQMVPPLLRPQMVPPPSSRPQLVPQPLARPPVASFLPSDRSRSLLYVPGRDVIHYPPREPDMHPGYRPLHVSEPNYGNIDHSRLNVYQNYPASHIAPAAAPTGRQDHPREDFASFSNSQRGMMYR